MMFGTGGSVDWRAEIYAALSTASGLPSSHNPKHKSTRAIRVSLAANHLKSSLVYEVAVMPLSVEKVDFLA
jgi:hypothetical protein